MAYVKFELKDGTTVYIESTDLPKGVSGLIPPDKGAAHAEPAEVSFTQAIESIHKMSEEMVEGLRSGFAEPPSDLSINFGLKASADLGSLFVSRGSAEANFHVSMTWRKDGKDEETKEEKKVKAKE